jgi:hypothetical protein
MTLNSVFAVTETGTTRRLKGNGKLQNIYLYVLNNEYPYSIGCFRVLRLTRCGVMVWGVPLKLRTFA